MLLDEAFFGEMYAQTICHWVSPDNLTNSTQSQFNGDTRHLGGYLLLGAKHQLMATLPLAGLSFPKTRFKSIRISFWIAFRPLVNNIIALVESDIFSAVVIYCFFCILNDSI